MWDNRMLPGHNSATVTAPNLIHVDDRNEKDLLDVGMCISDRKDLSDNGFSQAIIIQALDIKYHNGGY